MYMSGLDSGSIWPSFLLVELLPGEFVGGAHLQACRFGVSCYLRLLAQIAALHQHQLLQYHRHYHHSSLTLSVGYRGVTSRLRGGETASDPLAIGVAPVCLDDGPCTILAPLFDSGCVYCH